MKIEDLKNTKIYMSNEADVIKFQDKIFNLDIKMADGTTQVPNPSLKDMFFTINNNLRVYVDFGKVSFINNTRRQIFLDEVLAIEEPKEECEFKPFDKVLVRNGDDLRWRPRLFAWHYVDYDEPFPYPFETTDGRFYSYCIPYDENLANTTKNPVL